jgi:adenine-specific DNA-methyltransferase
MTTPYHAKYWAHSLRLARPRDGVAGLSRSIGNARVDLNPHQVDAALFALRSPYSKGVLLADEVGLGKTIEASLILAQKWAERRRRILLIVPATLRKQWQVELEEKFFLPSIILEARAVSALAKQGKANPFEVDDRIVLCSYQFAYAKRALIQQVRWDLVVVDEAHRLRGIYKGTKTAEGIVEAIKPATKLLLTATPLQNTLLELFGLVNILDENIFGGEDAFRAQFMTSGDGDARDAALRERIGHVCKRTLRRQVLEYIPFTQRFTHTADFVPSPAEEQLYDEVSAYLQREVLVALPSTQRKLMTLVLRKILASSSAAIGATLQKFADRLVDPTKVEAGKADAGEKAPSHEAKDAAPARPIEEELAEDFEALSELDEEWGEAPPPAPPPPAAPSSEAIAPEAAAEHADLERFVRLAQSVERDAKATKLVEVLPEVFRQAGAKGAARKAVIFTESVKTQQYLFQVLTEAGYEGEIVLMNGTNTDDTSRRIHAEWKKRHEHRWADVTSGSKSADMKAAIVEEFRDRGTLLLATESAAEGVNLQFCSVVINYDLPWNPQRIEQRIGRCHRYGQKCDVLVVNFLNRKNEADQRVFELLDQKFKLFRGVFGASDEVLGAVESGVDLEKRIAAIYQDCRSPAEIKAAFDHLQAELDETIRAGLDQARRAFLENFDAEVHERLQIHKEAAKQSLDAQQQTLLDLAKVGLGSYAQFHDPEPRFTLRAAEATAPQRFHLDWQKADALGDTFFRVDHPLAVKLIEDAAGADPKPAVVTFVHEAKASALGRYVGQSGWLEVSKLTTDAADRTEEHLLIAALTDGGEVLPDDVAMKLFTLDHARVGEPTSQEPPAALAAQRDALQHARSEEVEARNHSYFEEEVEKLDRWAEDRKLSLEKELQQLDVEIRAARKASKTGVSLTEKLAAQRAIKDLEQKRSNKRRELFTAQDEVERQRNALIEDMERQLAMKASRETLFTIRWVLEGRAGG